MQLDNRQEIKEKIEKIYKEFGEIYWDESNDQINMEKFEHWYKYCNEHNKKFGPKGYKFGEKGHKLGHYAILQTPIPELQKIPEKTKIVIVGKNNSWFVPDDMKESLKVVRELKKGIPIKNYYTERKSIFAKTIVDIFKDLNIYDLLEKNTVGMNRIWLQTGGNTAESNKLITKMKDPRAYQSIVGTCHKWTEKIIKLLNPELVLILGKGYEGADRLFEYKTGDYHHKNGQFFIKHCRHPSVGGKKKLRDEISDETYRFRKPISLRGGVKLRPIL